MPEISRFLGIIIVMYNNESTVSFDLRDTRIGPLGIDATPWGGRITEFRIDPNEDAAARCWTVDHVWLLADDGVDLVIVSTPPNTHAEWTLRALEAGKSVVVEKPFCLTVDEADRQIAAAKERGLTLAVYQNRRWDPDYLALKKVIRSGQIGEPIFQRAGHVRRHH